VPPVPGALPRLDPSDPSRHEPGAPRRVRAALARLNPTKPSTTSPAEIDELLRVLRDTHPKADVRPVQRAYEVAEIKHRGQLRRSGEPYITHPVAVATIAAQLGMDVTTCVAALLHDTVEDTSTSVEEIRTEFGETVARVVDGVTKLDKVKFGEAAEARRSARWSSRWRATSGARHQARRPAAQHAHARAMPPEKQATTPSRRWRSTRRWPTGSA
jgi:GTP pyrophosphokinase